MTIEHSLITDPNIGEPKGASTAALGEVIVSSGSGTTFWIEPAFCASLKLIGGSEAVTSIGTTAQALTVFDTAYSNRTIASTLSGSITLSESTFGNGIYVVNFNATIATSAVGDAGTYTFELREGASTVIAGCSVYMSGTDDLTNISFSTIGEFSFNDVFRVFVSSDEAGDTDDLVVSYTDLNLYRIQVG
jgi:hypothetical protein